MRKILIIDSTLRDGSHAIRHKLTKETIKDYCVGAEQAGIEVLVVGHGNGLGASSLHLGRSTHPDKVMLSTAKKMLKKTKLATFIIPGFATLYDIDMAIAEGVKTLFVASHCSEANTTKQYIKHAKVDLYGVLMMSHMIEPQELLIQAKLMESYGAKGILIMDSAGALLFDDVKRRIHILVNGLAIPVGFHGHNNLGIAIANSIVAIEEGATIIDATTRGLGAGAGNTQLEVLVALLHKMGYKTGLDVRIILKNTEIIAKIKEPQLISPLSIISGLSGVFSGFAPLVTVAAKKYNVDPIDIFLELGKRKVVAGQEDQILVVAKSLSHE